MPVLRRLTPPHGNHLDFAGAARLLAQLVAAHGGDPVDSLAVELTPLWGDVHRKRHVAWPLSVRAGRVGSVQAE